MDGAFVDDIPSPCIRVCLMHDRTGYCSGCLRSIKEIAAWSGLSCAEKLAVIAQLETRRTQHFLLADNRKL